LNPCPARAGKSFNLITQVEDWGAYGWAVSAGHRNTLSGLR